MTSGDLPAIIGAFGLLIGTVFTGLVGLGQRRTRLDQELIEENRDYHRWQPRVLRAVTLLRSTIAASPEALEPAGVDELIEWPPPKPRHARRDEVSADDAG